ncbi:MAG: alpha/beta hydrolase [Pseudomonadota bacterium]
MKYEVTIGRAASGAGGMAAGSPARARVELVEAAGPTGLSAWVALPERRGPDPTPLIAVHGIKRGARAQAAGFAARASAAGRPVVAPLFDTARWPLYQQAVRRGRADLALATLLDDLGLAGLPGTGRIDLFGYSAGAQFAHRFAMMHPQRVRRLSLAAAGWYTFPDDAPFPYGLGARRTVAGRSDSVDWGALMAARLAEFLAIPKLVAVGGADTLSDETLRRGAEIDRHQGANRVARARTYAAALEDAAAARGIATPPPRLTILPGVTHDFTECLAGGLATLVLTPPDAVRARSSTNTATTLTNGPFAGPAETI